MQSNMDPDSVRSRITTELGSLNEALRSQRVLMNLQHQELLRKLQEQSQEHQNALATLRRENSSLREDMRTVMNVLESVSRRLEAELDLKAENHLRQAKELFDLRDSNVESALRSGPSQAPSSQSAHAALNALGFPDHRALENSGGAVPRRSQSHNHSHNHSHSHSHTATELDEEEDIAMDAGNGGGAVSQLTNFQFSAVNSVMDVVEEWYHGIDGMMSVQALDAQFGSKWRGNARSKISKMYYRRKSLIKAIEKGVNELGMTRDEAINELEAARIRDDGGLHTIYWLYTNIPARLKPTRRPMDD